jgi:hypothetical protein
MCLQSIWRALTPVAPNGSNGDSLANHARLVIDDTALQGTPGVL